MTLSRWYIAKGPSDAMSYLLDVLLSGEVLWTEDRDSAHRFDRREDAAMMALHVASADPRAEVATLPDAGQQQVQHHAGSMRVSDLDYVRRAMTARDTRVGPGPERPAVHEIDPGGFQCGDQSSRTGAMRGGTRVERYPESHGL